MKFSSYDRGGTFFWTLSIFGPIRGLRSSNADAAANAIVVCLHAEDALIQGRQQ